MDHLKGQTEFRDMSESNRKVNIVTSESAYDSEPTSPNKNPERSKSFEKPKAVSSSRKRDVIVSWAVYHLPPLAVTVVLTIMYVQQWTWPHPGPSDEETAVLQFPAKIHECLIVASLSNILFHRLRYLLIKSDKGVPLGLVTTPFQLNNPLYYVGPEFLGSLRRLLASFPIFLTFGLVMVIAILSLAANPFSAVLLIPRKLTFPVPASHPAMQGLINRGFLEENADKDGLYLADTIILPVDRQFPMSFGSELGATWTCPGLGNLQGNCVSFFQDLFPDIISKALGTDPDDFTDIESDPLNITIGGAKSQLRVNSFQLDVEVLGLVEGSSTDLSRVTSPLRIATEPLFLVQRSIDNNPNVTNIDVITSSTWSARNRTMPSIQPQILTHTCRGSITTSELSLEYLMSVGWGEELEGERNYANCFVTGWFPGFQFRMTERLATQLLRQNWTTGFALFVDIQDQVPFPISGAYIIVGTKSEADQTIQPMEITYFVASWERAAPTSVKYFRRVLTAPITGGNLLTPVQSLLNQTSANSSSVVRMDANWLNTLDIFPFEIIPTSNGFPRLHRDSMSLFTHIPQADGSMPYFLAMIMASAQGIFGALRQNRLMCVAPNGRACYTGPEDGGRPIVYELAQNVTGSARDLPENQLQLRVKLEQEAFGYKFEGTTIMLAFAFLYLHMLLVVAHSIVIVVGGFWSSSAWTNLTDFVVLGMGSTPSEFLRNAGAGVAKWRTWAFLTSVRSVGRDQRLELVVFDDEKDDLWELEGKMKPKRNVKYS